MKKYLLKLHLFEGEGAGTGSAPGAAGEPGNGVGNQQTEQIIYGKEPENDEGNKGNVAQTQETMSFKEMLNSNPSYKKDMENTVQSRVKNIAREKADLQQRLDAQQAIMDNLYSRYNIKDGNIEALQQQLMRDTSYLEIEADERGMTVDQLRYVKELEAQNLRQQREMQLTQEQRYQAQLQQKWLNESAAMINDYPDFDFVYEINNNEIFHRLILSNVPVKDAYEFAHREEFQQANMQAFKSQMAQSIKSGQSRPKEAGAKGQPGVTYKSDPSKYSSKDIQNIRERVSKGEKITL